MQLQIFKYSLANIQICNMTGEMTVNMRRISAVQYKYNATAHCKPAEIKGC